MIPLNPWEHQSAVKALYHKCVGPVCQRHGLTRMDVDVLLFLANNPRFDTATDIVETRHLAKSHVSASVNSLERRGFLMREYADGNRKTAHLKLCKSANDIISDGQAAQEKFLSAMLDGFSPAELKAMEDFNARILRNINTCLKEENPC